MDYENDNYYNNPINFYSNFDPYFDPKMYIISKGYDFEPEGLNTKELIDEYIEYMLDNAESEKYANSLDIDLDNLDIDLNPPMEDSELPDFLRRALYGDSDSDSDSDSVSVNTVQINPNRNYILYFRCKKYPPQLIFRH